MERFSKIPSMRLALAVGVVALLTLAVPGAMAALEAEVTVGSEDLIFSQNKQN